MRIWLIVVACVLLTAIVTSGIIYVLAPSLPVDMSNVAETLRFYKSETISANGSDTYINLGFWIPKDSTNNAIINIVLYFQYFTPNSTSHLGFTFAQTDVKGLQSLNQFTQSKAYSCSLPSPNSANYTMKMALHNDDTSDRSNIVYVKDINVILQVIDGLPSS
jgi:hypothetical protein